MKLHALLLLLPLTTLADTERLPYACDNGSRVEIGFAPAADGRPQATLHFADGTLTLPQVPSAGGALYRDQEIRLHTSGDEALFEDGKGNSRRCRRGDTPPPPPAAAPAAAASSFLDISGSVAYPARRPLPPQAVLVIRVQHRARAGAPARTLAEQRIELAGQQLLPIPFQTSIDRDLLGDKARVTVAARIEANGKPLFVSARAYPALSNGQPQHVDIQLQAVRRAPAR